jgi:hypothetical protein
MDKITAINHQALIPKEKLIDKDLDQMSLPERTDLLKEAYSLLEGADDITEQEMEVVERLETAVEQRVASWGLIISKTKEAADLCKIEQEYYKGKAEEAKQRGERFKRKSAGMGEYLKHKMIELNLKKVETPSLTVSLRKKPQSVIISDHANLEDPENLVMVKTVVSKTWDKKEIKKLLDAGDKLQHAHLSEPDFSITIKQG